MDPRETLSDARDLLFKAGKRGECAQLLVAYIQWRLKGGFEAKPDGDARALAYVLNLGTAADVLSEALVGSK
jgi:hypothetical protein